MPVSTSYSPVAYLGSSLHHMLVHAPCPTTVGKQDFLSIRFMSMSSRTAKRKAQFISSGFQVQYDTVMASINQHLKDNPEDALPCWTMLSTGMLPRAGPEASPTKSANQDGIKDIPLSRTKLGALSKVFLRAVLQKCDPRLNTETLAKYEQGDPKTIYKLFYLATMSKEGDNIVSHDADCFVSAYSCRYNALGRRLKDIPMSYDGATFPWNTSGVFIMMAGEGPCSLDGDVVTSIMYAGTVQATRGTKIVGSASIYPI